MLFLCYRLLRIIYAETRTLAALYAADNSAYRGDAAHIEGLLPIWAGDSITACFCFFLFRHLMIFAALRSYIISAFAYRCIEC